MSDNKRIAKNTLFLYFRSLLMMAVNLYASRIILQALGVDDYGLYGAIGSIVAMFAIVNGTLSSGTSRFLTYELGKENREKLKDTFCASFAMHLGLAVVLFVLMETVGLWFVNSRMNIPMGREFAANVVYQMSILTCMFSLTQVPYSASIIAHEKMSIYAYIGIAEALFKLLLVLFLLKVPFSDNLIVYAVILAIWNIGLQIFYRFYCGRLFQECRLSICRKKEVYKGMLAFSMWDVVGSFCATGNSQGLNILINIFFGVTINAGRAIAYQVENAITQLTNNFVVAVQPQIVKNYAQNNIKRFLELIFESSRFSYFLLYVVSLPVILEGKFILNIWLVEVPETTLMFLKFAVVYQLFRIPMRAVVQGVHATGQIKFLNLTSGCYSAGTFLLANYVAFKLGAPVWACFVVQAFNGVIITFFEMNSLCKNVKFSRFYFVKHVFLVCIALSLASSVPAVLLNILMPSTVARFVLTIFLSITVVPACVFCFGLSKESKDKIVDTVKRKIGR